MDDLNKKADPEVSINPNPSGDQNLEEQLAQSETQKAEYLAGWQRAKADFINYKKDEMKRLEELAKYGSEELMAEIVTVLDNFDLGLKALEKAGPVEKGIYMIKSQIEDILKKRGLEKISIAPGSDFDPSVAEAMSEIESEHPPGTVVDQIEPGYKLYDKIIRPARVRISKSH